MPDKVLCGLGNPLLDIVAKVAPGYVQRWNLDSNAQINAQEDHLGPVSKGDCIYEIYFGCLKDLSFLGEGVQSAGQKSDRCYRHPL